MPIPSLPRIAVSAVLLATLLAGCAGAPSQRPVELGPVAKGPGTLLITEASSHKRASLHVVRGEEETKRQILLWTVVLAVLAVRRALDERDRRILQ